MSIEENNISDSCIDKISLTKLDDIVKIINRMNEIGKVEIDLKKIPILGDFYDVSRTFDKDSSTIEISCDNGKKLVFKISSHGDKPFINMSYINLSKKTSIRFHGMLDNDWTGPLMTLEADKIISKLTPFFCGKEISWDLPYQNTYMFFSRSVLKFLYEEIDEQMNITNERLRGSTNQRGRNLSLSIFKETLQSIK